MTHCRRSRRSTAFLAGRKPRCERVRLDLPRLADNGLRGADAHRRRRARSRRAATCAGDPPLLRDQSGARHGGVRVPAAASSASRSTSRIRLAGTQQIVAVAEMSDGTLLRGGDRSDRHPRRLHGRHVSARHAMPDARITVPDRVARGEPFEVRILIRHPMETGYRTDDIGQVDPAQRDPHAHLPLQRRRRVRRAAELRHRRQSLPALLRDRREPRASSPSSGSTTPACAAAERVAVTVA